MIGSYYALSADPRRRRLVLAMNAPMRVTFLLFWASLTLALAPALVPGTGVVVEPEGWIPAGLLWTMALLGLGWRDRWVFEASGVFHRDQGWAVFVHRTTRPLDGFAGWEFVSRTSTKRLPGGRSTLEFSTARGLWKIDAAFRADRLGAQRAVFDLWTAWYHEGRTS